LSTRMGILVAGLLCCDGLKQKRKHYWPLLVMLLLSGSCVGPPRALCIVGSTLGFLSGCISGCQWTGVMREQKCFSCWGHITTRALHCLGVLGSSRCVVGPWLVVCAKQTDPGLLCTEMVTGQAWARAGMHQPALDVVNLPAGCKQGAFHELLQAGWSGLVPLRFDVCLHCIVSRS